MSFDDWKDAVDRALGGGLRCSAMDPSALQSLFSSGASPVIAARQLSANPPMASQPTTVLPTPTVATDPQYAWISPSPKLMRVIGAVIMGAAGLMAIGWVLVLLALLLGPVVARDSRLLAGVMVIGIWPTLMGLVGTAVFAGIGQIVLVAAEATERMRRT